MHERPETVAIVGTGRLASALAAGLARSSTFALLGVYGRRPQAARELAERYGGRSLALAQSADADVVFVAVADRAIAEVASALAREAPQAREGQLCLHGSGALGLDELIALRHAGRRVATLHPLASLPDGAAAPLQDQVLVVAGEPAAQSRACRLGRELGGQPVWVEALDRVRYHAAAALLANGMTAVFAAGSELLASASAGVLGSREAESLVQSALRPLRSAPPSRALTGPIRRGDADVVRAHRAALADGEPHTLAMYDAVMRGALELSRRDGLDAALADSVARALEDGSESRG